MEHAILPFRYALCRIELAVNARLRRIGTIALIIPGLVVAAVLGYPDIIEAITTELPVEDPGFLVFFSGNRAAFGFPLLSLFSSAERRLGQECVSPFRSRW